MKGREKWGGEGGVAGGEECTATPEESDGYNVITITGNLPVPCAPENVEGLVRNPPPPPHSNYSPRPSHSHTEICVRARTHTHTGTQRSVCASVYSARWHLYRWTTATETVRAHGWQRNQRLPVQLCCLPGAT